MHTWLSAVDVAVHRGTKGSDAASEAASSEAASSEGAKTGKNWTSWNSRGHGRMARTRVLPHGAHNDHRRGGHRALGLHHGDAPSAEVRQQRHRQYFLQAGDDTDDSGGP